MRNIPLLRITSWPLLHVVWCLPASAQCAVQWLPGDAVAGVHGGQGFQVGATTMWDLDGAGPAPARLVVAGSFTSVANVLAKNVVAWEPVSGTWTALGAGIEGAVQRLAVMPNGDLVAAGDFTMAGGAAANNIARWDGTAWSPLGGGTNGRIWALTVLANGTLVVAGDFTMVGGTAIAKLASWNGTSWTSPAASLNGDVWATAALPNGDLVASGSFTTIQGVAANYIARWDGSAWWPLGSGTNTGAGVLYTQPNGELVASGTFTNAGGVAAPGIAKWNGTAWSALGAGVSGIGTMTTLANGDLAVATIPAGYISRWNGTAWSTLGNTFTGFINGAVWTMAVLPNGDLVAGGAFSLVGGSLAPVIPASRLARFDGTSWSALVAGTDQSVNAITTLPNGDVVAAGAFRATGGVLTNHVARWDGTNWSALGSGMTAMYDEVRAVTTMPDGSVVAGGGFGMAGGVLANNIARWNGTTWLPLGSGTNSLPYVGAGIQCLTVLPNGDLIAGGYFTSAGGVPCNNIARWDGTSWSAMGAGLNAQVYALATLPNGDVVAGGYLSTAGSVAAHCVARWDGTAWSALGTSAFGPPGNPVVLSLAAMPNGDVVAGGSFLWLGGVFANCIARWNGSSWSPLGPGLYGEVRSLTVVPNGDVVAGGRFTLAGVVTANRVARWDGTVWSAMDSGMDGRVCAVQAQPDGSLLAGGEFTVAGNHVSAYFARLTTNCPATAVAFGNGCAGSGGFNTLSATSLPWTGSTYRAVANGMPANASAVVVYGFANGSVPLQAILPQGVPGCSLLVSPDALEVHVTTGGTVATSLPIPNLVALAGLILHQQVVPFEFDLAGNLTALTSSNALTLTIGTF